MSNHHHHRHHHRHNLQHDEVSHQDNLNLPKTNTNPRKLVMFFLKCIIMTCIISLFLLFLGFATLVLLHFLFITTACRRRRTATTTITMVNLPEIIYDSTVLAQTEVIMDCCAICLEGFNEGELCRSLPPCGHFFHVSCVDSWLMKVPSCPVCRTRVRLGPHETSLVMSNDDWKIWWAVSN